MTDFLITMGINAFISILKSKDAVKARKFRNIAAKVYVAIDAAYQGDAEFTKAVITEKRGDA